MKKNSFLLRFLIGAPIGLAINTLIAILFSCAVGDGNFYPVVPELMEYCGSELNAVLLQAGCSLLYGGMWGGASVFWSKENWSLLRQTLTHLAVCSASTFPMAYCLRWMPHTLLGIAGFFTLFFCIYFFIWLSQYCLIKTHIKQINKKVQENNTSI